VKNVWRITNSRASIWCKKYPQILFCLSKLSVPQSSQFPRAAVLENYTLLETDNLCGQLCEYISNQMGTIVYRNTNPRQKQCCMHGTNEALRWLLGSLFTCNIEFITCDTLLWGSCHNCSLSASLDSLHVYQSGIVFYDTPFQNMRYKLNSVTYSRQYKLTCVFVLFFCVLLIVGYFRKCTCTYGVFKMQSCNLCFLQSVSQCNG